MKERYYPSTNFLNADLGKHPSYVWRGVMAAMEAVKSGSRRKIGNGEDMIVWNIPWLRDLSNGFINIPEHIHLRDIKVCSLMVTGENKWDNELLHDVFENRDVVLIKRIPLRFIDKADS